MKAVQRKKWRKAQRLQHLLTRSRSAKQLAVLRVTENQGKLTPGVDGIVWTTPAQKRAAVVSLRQRGYRALPLRRVYIPKKNGKLRPLGLPTLRDRAMQAVYLQALEPIAETVGDPHSYGFRPGRGCADALAQVHTLLSRKGGPEWVLEGDIQACFDRIDHHWLLAHLPVEKPILRQWLQAGYLEHADWYPTEAGTPQGGIISPVLANLTLDGLQARLAQAFPRRPGEPAPQVHLVRYADDFLITGCSRELLEQQVQPLVTQFLAERGLVLSPEKTVITHIDTGFDFLGQHVRRYGGPEGKVLTKPANRAVQTFYQGLRQVVRASLHLDAGSLIRVLNAKIRGWTNYHRHGCSSATFAQLDHQIFRLLWWWAQRRHPNKRASWLRRHYFTQIGGRQWVLQGWQPTAHHGTKRIYLVSAGNTRIRRHVKVRSDLNPYTPEGAAYLQHRRSDRAARSRPALKDSASRETAALQRATPSRPRSTPPARAPSRPRIPKTLGCVGKA